MSKFRRDWSMRLLLGEPKKFLETCNHHNHHHHHHHHNHHHQCKECWKKCVVDAMRYCIVLSTHYCMVSLTLYCIILWMQYCIVCCCQRGMLQFTGYIQHGRSPQHEMSYIAWQLSLPLGFSCLSSNTSDKY